MASLLGSKTASVQAMAALGADLNEAQKKQFDTISKKPFRDQAVWFLNGFWVDGPNFSENADRRELMWCVFFFFLVLFFSFFFLLHER
jgi:hypothetical protein